MQHLIRFGEVKDRAAALNRPLAEYARRAGISPSTVWSWERGDHEPRGSKLELVAAEVFADEVRMLTHLLTNAFHPEPGLLTRLIEGRRGRAPTSSDSANEIGRSAA